MQGGLEDPTGQCAWELRVVPGIRRCSLEGLHGAGPTVLGEGPAGL